MIIPVVLERNIFPLYNSIQVHKYLGESDYCAEFSIAEYLYYHDKLKIFKPVLLSNCQRNNNQFICPRRNFPDQISCFQEKNFTCTASKIKCKGNFEFRMLSSGILIRNNNFKNSYSTDLNKITRIIELNKYHVAFIYWENVTSVQVDNTRIVSPAIPIANTKLINYHLNLSLGDFNLDIENVSRTFTELGKTYNSSLESLMSPVFHEFNTNGTWKLYGKWIIPIIVTVIVIFAAALVLFSCYRYKYVLKKPEKHTEISNESN